MESTIITTMLIGLLIGSAIGGLPLKLFAKYVGKISSATYVNSFVVCFISSIIYLAIFYIMGTETFKVGFAGILFINILILSAAYITVGKYVWKCEWIKSVKANIIWIIIYAIITAYTLSKYSL